MTFVFHIFTYMFIIEVELIRWHQLKIYLSDCCWDLELNQFILLQQMNHNNRLKLKLYLYVEVDYTLLLTVKETISR